MQLIHLKERMGYYLQEKLMNNPIGKMNKISIRFFDDREVRAIWDEENSKWWYSVLDIVGVLNAQDDYTKNRNYWKYLKGKLKKTGSQLVSATNQLKLKAADGKSYVCLDRKVLCWNKKRAQNFVLCDKNIMFALHNKCDI